MTTRLIGVFMLAAFLVAGVALAEGVPALVNYQGKLVDSGGVPVTNGMYDVAFRIWGHETAADVANYIWGREYSVYVVDGRFHVMLGADGGTAVTEPGSAAEDDIRNAFQGEVRYLGITVTSTPEGPVGSPQELSPRQQFLSAPYTLRSARAEQLGDYTAAQYLLKAALPSTTVDPPQALGWTGTEGQYLPIYRGNNNNIGIGDDAPPDAAALSVKGGALQLVRGTGSGVDFNASGSADFAKLAIEDTGNGVTTMRMSVGGDDNDKMIVESTGGDTDLKAGRNGTITAVATQNVTAASVNITASQTLTLSAGTETVIKGTVKSFKPMVPRSLDTTYTAETDGFLMVYVFNKQIEVRIGTNPVGTEGSDYVEFSMETDETDSSNDNMSASFPVAKGEKYRVHTIDTGSGAQTTIRWRPIGLAL